jgi:hypothetical protein
MTYREAKDIFVLAFARIIKSLGKAYFMREKLGSLERKFPGHVDILEH